MLAGRPSEGLPYSDLPRAEKREPWIALEPQRIGSLMSASAALQLGGRPLNLNQVNTQFSRRRVNGRHAQAARARQRLPCQIIIIIPRRRFNTEQTSEAETANSREDGSFRSGVLLSQDGCDCVFAVIAGLRFPFRGKRE